MLPTFLLSETFVVLNMDKKQKRWLWVVIVLAVLASIVYTAVKWLLPVAVIVYFKEIFM